MSGIGHLGSEEESVVNVIFALAGGQGQTEGVLRGSQRSRRPPPPANQRTATKNNRDNSLTQFAVIDDENLSAMQQVTRGGGGTSQTYCIHARGSSTDDGILVLN